MHADGGTAALEDVKDIFVADPGTGTTSRLAFGRNNMLFIATSGSDPQNPNTYGGKVLRLRDDGTVPMDNPLLTDLRQRIRDVRQGPDGLLYLVTDEKDGAVLRIEPAP